MWGDWGGKMFESAEHLGHHIDKDVHTRRRRPVCAPNCSTSSTKCWRRRRFPWSSLVSGVDGSGKGETINLLYSWMDPRHISTLAFAEPSDEERERLHVARYWRALPPKGKIGIFAGSWYSQPISERISGEKGRAELAERLEEIQPLQSDAGGRGALVLKFWFHLSREAQKKRLKLLASNPQTAWRVSKKSTPGRKPTSSCRRRRAMSCA